MRFTQGYGQTGSDPRGMRWLTYQNPIPIHTVSGSSTGSGCINFSIDSRIIITQSASRKTAFISAPRTSARPQPKVFISFRTLASLDLFDTVSDISLFYVSSM